LPKQTKQNDKEISKEEMDKTILIHEGMILQAKESLDLKLPDMEKRALFRIFLNTEEMKQLMLDVEQIKNKAK